ncbi:hypothetical protein BBJ28_00015138 [Nothophytophthora sp. Chile5]|nr:hypothetical protein BBJ28_00015138 [Nothophytophthora sp. Chile5]
MTKPGHLIVNASVRAAIFPSDPFQMASTSAFEAALAVLWALGAAVVLAKATPATRGGPSVFPQATLALMVLVQLYYLYQAAKHQLPIPD